MAPKKSQKRTRKTKKSQTTSKMTCSVTLLKNGFVAGVFYKEGDTVEVSKSERKRLMKASPEVYA